MRLAALGLALLLLPAPLFAQDAEEEEDTPPEAPNRVSIGGDPFGDDEEPPKEAPPKEAPAEVKPAAEKPAEAPPAEPPQLPAPSTPKVLALVLGASAQTVALAHRVGAETTLRLARARNLTPVDLETAVAPGARAQRAAEVRAGLTAIDKGMQAFDDLDLDIAGGALEEGVNALLSHLDDLTAEERRTLEAAIFTYGAATLFEGQTELAESIFISLVLISPGYAPDAEHYPSNVVSRFGDLKGRADQRPTGGLTIHSTPEGAEIWVDGVLRGASPVEVTALTDGQHVVVAKKLGHRPFGTLAPVTAERMSSLDVDLPPLEGVEVPALEPYLAEDLGAALEIGRRLGADLLLVLRLDTPISGNRVSGQWISVGQAQRLATLPSLAVSADPETAAPAIVQALGAAEARAVEPPPALVSADEGLTGQWWFWAVVGGVAVAAASAVTVVAVGGGTERPPSNGLILGF